jgi:hypothetical protein
MVVFWAAMPCGLIGRYQLSEEHSISIKDGDWSSEIRWILVFRNVGTNL